jgi:hypothetical protein
MAIFRDYLAAAIIFNLQILPETLTSGLLLLAVVLGSGPVLALATGVGGTQLFTTVVSRLLMRYAPDSAQLMSTMDGCTQGYVGKSWQRLLRDTLNPEQLWHPRAPSVYQATIGFVAGYGLALQHLYRDEIKAGVLSGSLMMTTGILAGLVMLLTLLFRVSSGCESVFSAVLGILLGLFIGYIGTIALGYSTDRRATNIWGIPLLRDRINNGSAIYVCQT